VRLGVDIPPEPEVTRGRDCNPKEHDVSRYFTFHVEHTRQQEQFQQQSREQQWKYDGYKVW
jgi:hypothetical protein